MKCVNNIWLPDEEEEVTKFVRASVIDGVGVYQIHKLQEAIKYVTRWNLAVDIGGHCGLWSMQLKKHFSMVVAFEPIERHRECFKLNAPDVELHPYALGQKESTVCLKKGIKSTGDTHVSDEGEYKAEMKPLDSFNLTPDFIKIDCEGYELFVLQGGEKTIDLYKPAIIVEQKPGKASSFGLKDTEAVDWLKEKGYKLRGVIAGDYILSV